MGPQVEFKGFADAMVALRAVPANYQARVKKGMVATMCSVIRNEAIARAPVYTGKVQEGHPPAGTLKRAIYQTRLVSECTENVETWMVSVRKGQTAAGAKGGSRDAYYASWVEYGHYTRGPSARSSSERKALAAGEHATIGTYYINAQPYMRPAFETTKQQAVEAGRAYLQSRLADLLTKA